MKCDFCHKPYIYSGEKHLCKEHFKTFEKYRKAKEKMIEALNEL